MVDAYTNDAEPTVTYVATQDQGSTDNYNAPIGLQWWNDQLYAIVDFDSLILTTVTDPILPGDVLDISGTAQNIVVRDVQVVSGAYSDGDAVLKVNFSWLDVGDYNVASKRVTFAPAATVNIIRGSLTISGVGVVGTTATVLATRMAGLFRSWGIDTLPDGSAYTDQGWQEIDLGYITTYTSVSQDSGEAFTSAGRDSQPDPSALQNIIAGQTNISGNTLQTATTIADSHWHTGVSNTLPQVVNIINDSKNVGTFQAPTSGITTSDVLSITGFDFSALPADAFISGLEVTISGSAASVAGPLYSNAAIRALPTSALLTGASPKNTTPLSFTNALVTSGTFIIAAVGVNQSVTVSSVNGLAVNNTIYISDGLHTIHGTITAIVGSVLSVTTVSIDLGVAGNTMASAAVVKLLHVLGGPTDVWSSPNITVASLQDPSFTLQLTAVNGSNSITGATSIDWLQVKVYYQTTSSVYYFWNGVDDVQGVITTYTIEDGDFATSTASGTIQVANVTPVGSAARAMFSSGDQIRNLPAGAGVSFGSVGSDGVYAGLPSRNSLKTNESQYEFITANFYGNNDWEAIYGVSGAGRAFTYDGFFFKYIFTGLNDTLDIPRHLAFHNFHLCLQYATGAVLASVTGLPESFDGTLGAAEFDTGDAGTGLLRMNGTTLGIFGRKSIQGLNGTDTTNFSLNILNPYEGAIEYTVVDCGKPVYCSYKGISTFDQTSAYGSFLGNRLSANITPWLLPRLTNQPVPIETQLFSLGAYQPSTGGILFAMPVRNKNQLRVYFKDGYCLTLTFQGAEQTPTFTLQQITFTKGEGLSTQAFTLIPFAHSSGVDSNGKDRNHLSFYDPIGIGNNNSEEYKYVYELDRGWGFGSYPIQAYFTTAHNFFNNPLEWANFRKIRLHGQSKGACTISAAVSANYGVEDFQFGAGYTTALLGPPPIPTQRTNAAPQDLSLPRAGFTNSPYTLTYDYQPATNICNVAKLGLSFSVQFVTNPTTIEPPHAAQALMLQISETKASV